MMTLRDWYREARESKCGIIGHHAIYAWHSAKTLAKWHALESVGAVRLRSEPDTDWEADCDCGDPRCPNANPDSEAFGSIGEYRTDWHDLDTWHIHDPDEWEQADSVWGHVGYRDVLDWKENPYILDIMAETIAAFRESWKAHVKEQAPCDAESARSAG